MRLALFDLDDTLVDRASAFRHSLEQLQHDLGIESPDFVPFILRHANRDSAAGWLSWMQAAQEAFSFTGEAATLVEQQRERYVALVEIEQEVIAALAELRGDDWRIVVVTNGPPTQLDVARRCGLMAAVDDCLISAVVGLRKPDPAIFALAAQRVGGDLGHDAVWMIGDSPSDDIGGAVGVGINSIWISHGRRWTHPLFAPTETFDTIAEAFDRLIGRTDAGRASG